MDEGLSKGAAAGIAVATLPPVTGAIASAVASAPVLGAFAAPLMGVVYAGMGGSLVMKPKFSGVEEIGKVLVGAGALTYGLSKLVSQVPDLAWLAGVGLLLLYAGFLKKLPFVGKFIPG